MIQVVVPQRMHWRHQARSGSIATLNLAIKDLNVGDTAILACDSAEWNGVMYDTSGIYVDTLQSIT